MKYQDFEQITRSRSFSAWIESRAAVTKASLELLNLLFPVRKGVRLLGVTLSSLNTENETEPSQLSLTLPV